MTKLHFHPPKPRIPNKKKKSRGNAKLEIVKAKQKFVLIDGKYRENWRYLRGELGYKQDSYFVKYLLRLAQKDLIRKKKKNEDPVKGSNSSNVNEKQSHPKPLLKTKPGKPSNPLEIAKKGKLSPKAGHDKGAKIKTSSQSKVVTQAGEGNFGDKKDPVTAKPGKSISPDLSNNPYWPVTADWLKAAWSNKGPLSQKDSPESKNNANRPPPEDEPKKNANLPPPKDEPKKYANRPPPEDEPKNSANRPPPEDKPKKNANLPPPKDEPKKNANLPPPKDEPKKYANRPPPEDEPKKNANLPPPKDEPKKYANRPPPEDEPKKNANLPPPEDKPKKNANLPPPEDKPKKNANLPPLKDEPKKNANLPPPKDEPKKYANRPPPEDKPKKNANRPPPGDEPKKNANLPPPEDKPKKYANLPPPEDEPKKYANLPPPEDEPKKYANLPPLEDELKKYANQPPPEDEPKKGPPSQKASPESKNNANTEDGKDLYLDSITSKDRNSGQNLGELSARKDQTQQTSPGNGFCSFCKNLSAIADESSHKSRNKFPVRNARGRGRSNAGGRANSGQKEVGRKRERARSYTRKPEKDKKGPRRSYTRKKQNEADIFKSEVKVGKGSRSTARMKSCAICKKRHLPGKCQEGNYGYIQSQAASSSFPGHRESEYEIVQASGSKNVYDFDENEQDINIDGSSRWSHKLLKTRNVGNNVLPVTMDQANSAELMDTSSVYAAPANAGGSGAGTSGTKLKLKINGGIGGKVSFAESTLPDHLVLRTFDEEHGPSVFTTTPIPKATRFGPLMGKKIREMDIMDDFDLKYIWEIDNPDGMTYLTTKNPETSNWPRFLRPANSKSSANLVYFAIDNELYFTSTRDIHEGEELVYWMEDSQSVWAKKKIEKKNCGACNIQYNHTIYYRKHCMIFHDPSCSLTIRKYHCKICGLAVLGKEKIMKHAAEFHQGKGAYQCQFCHKFFLRLNYLEMHRTYGCAKNPRRNRPLCDLCGRKFCQPQKLKIHIKRMHSDMAEVLKDFQCKSCLKILGSRAALQRHVKEVHTKHLVGACACGSCGKMFQNKSNLKIHLLTHSGVKPFKCQQTDCDAAFTTKQCLQFHYKKAHGFTDGFIPKIERSIAYTFDAYSGGVVTEPAHPQYVEDQSPRYEEYQSPTPEQREYCLDLSLVNSLETDRVKEKVRVEFICQPDSITPDETPRIVPPAVDFRRLNQDGVYERSPEHDAVQEEEMTGNNFTQDANPDNYQSRIVVNKGSKKWILSETSDDRMDERIKSLFRHDNPNASMLVEAVINSSEKDIIDKPAEKLPVAGQENIIETPAEVYSLAQYEPVSPAVVYDPNEKKYEEYGKSPLDIPKPDTFQGVENKKCFPGTEKSNFNDFLRCSSMLKINTSPMNEIPKDYNISSIIRDQETETFSDIELQDYRNRDSVEGYRENEAFHDQYRAHEMYRNEKLDLYRSGGQSDLRMQSNVDKFEHRDFDVSNEAYRNLATNLEKYRSADLYRMRSEGYDMGAGYRNPGADQRNGEAQNLCLKEKSFQYDTLEEIARIGRDNPGFEGLLVGDSSGAVANQPFAAGAPRLHGMLSPRPYHPPYEGESVDLSVPRPSYTSPPIYSLDLTPARVEIPTRHLDFRSHLALPPHRFPSTRLPGLSNGGPQMSPTGYGVYTSPYVPPTARHSPPTQFQPYTSLYY